MELRHLIADEEPSTPTASASSANPPPPQPSAADDPAAVASMPRKKAEENNNDDSSHSTPRADGSNKQGEDGEEPLYTSTTTSTRRNANGQTSSVYSGNKMRHLKKEDGIPLWRKDIQYDFLQLVFSDKTPCFTKYSDGTTGHTFAEVYIDAMAKSSKCSKILKEKLLQDQEGAISMAMVCLLVNVGRMNTTLNFFPEMRAQLRTYHSIPALQAHQDPNAYKQLQDAPRLKSILKGATEDQPQPSTMEEIKAAQVPRTNPVNLIFVMSQYAPKISEVHFPPPRDFFDLVMRSSLSSASRARAFLWLIWWYLESDFSIEDTQRNPFGAGQYGEGEEGTGVLPLKVPNLESLTEEQAELENVDTEDEQLFGEVKRKERIAILASEPSPAMTALKRARKEKGLTGGHGMHPSDDEGSEAGFHHRAIREIDANGAKRQEKLTSGVAALVGKASALAHETGSEYTRSPSPAASRGFQSVNVNPVGDMRINNLLNSDDVGPDMSPSQVVTAPAATAPVKKGPGRGNWRRHKKLDAAGGTTRTAQDSPHHVPLLPNTGQLNFVNEGPQHMQASGYGGNSSIPSVMKATPTTISFQAPNTGDHIPTPSYQAQKRHRGVTQHQSAVINHRKLQIDYHLDRRIRKEHERAREKREATGPILRAWKRIRSMPQDYDSEEEAIKVRKAKDRAEKIDDDWRTVRGGKENDDFMADIDMWRRPRVMYAGYVRTSNEPSDVGEEAKSLAQAFRRASRRLDRWHETQLPGQLITRRQELERQGMLRPHRHSIVATETDGIDAPTARAKLKRQRSSRSMRRGASRGDVDGDNDAAPELDEEDRELLGEVDADESEEDDDEDMDD